MKFGHVARYLLCLFLYYCGILFVARGLRRLRGKHRLVILAYHSFSDAVCYLDMAVSPSLFIKQVEYLCKAYRVQALSDALATSERATGVGADTAVITVDDGYADNFQPLLQAATEFAAPSTLYLTTNCIDEREPTAVMWIMLAIHHATVDSIKLPEIGFGTLCIGTREEKESAIRQIDGCVKLLSPPQRSEVIAKLVERTGQSQLIHRLGQSAMLQWNQIRTMHVAGVEIGAHTLTHPTLSRLDPVAANYEIVASIRRVKEMVGRETITFAYPYGGEADVSRSVVEACRESGARAAVMLVAGDMPGNDLFRIPRVMVTSDLSTSPSGRYSQAMWACELEGLVGSVRKLLLPPSRGSTSVHDRYEANP